MLRAVVFDLDDTLYPERQYVVGGFRAVAAWAERELGLLADDCAAELEALLDLGVRGDTFNELLRQARLRTTGVGFADGVGVSAASS